MSSGIRARGFSIIELLVAAALTLILLGGVAAIFVGTRDSSAAAERVSDLHERGRQILDRLAYDIRNAGFSGCTGAPSVAARWPTRTGEAGFDLSGTAVHAYEANNLQGWNPPLRSDTAPMAATGSDVLVLRVPRRNSVPLRLQRGMATPNDPVTVIPAARSHFKSGDVAMIYDCVTHAYFRVAAHSGGILVHATGTANAGDLGTPIAGLQYVFSADAEVLPMQTVVYYVRASSSGHGRSLWQHVDDNEPQELTADVEQMQLQFGAAAREDATADAIKDWSLVDSVTITLSMQGREPADPSVGKMLRTSDTGSSPVRSVPRQSLTTVVALRNR